MEWKHDQPLFMTAVSLMEDGRLLRDGRLRSTSEELTALIESFTNLSWDDRAALMEVLRETLSIPAASSSHPTATAQAS